MITFITVAIALLLAISTTILTLVWKRQRLERKLDERVERQIDDLWRGRWKLDGKVATQISDLWGRRQRL